MRRTGALAAAFAVTLLAGCSASDPDMPGLTATPSAEPSATTSATPTPTPTGARDLSDPELGIVFTDYPHDPDEQTVAVVETYMLFEKEFWRASTTNSVPPGPWVVASDDAIAWIRAQVESSDTRQGGTLETALSLVAIDESTATLDVCRVLGEVTFVDPDGATRTAAEAGLPATAGVRATLDVVPSGGWQVVAVDNTGDC